MFSENDYDYDKRESKLYNQVRYSAKKSFEEYYYSFCAISVFLLGAFALYIATRISKGIFIIIDIGLMYVIIKSFYEFRKNKERENIALQYQMKFLNRIYKYAIIILVESICRHFLSQNIVIIKYVMVMGVFYIATYILYKVIKMYMKKRYIQELEKNNYKKIIEWKSLKHKLFVILSFFMFMVLVISNMMNIVKGVNLLILMTIIYIIILIVTIEIKCDLEIEQELIFNSNSFDFFSIDYEYKDDFKDDDNFENIDFSTSIYSKEIDD
ncbi:hypothetical protein [uncultured Clostridium sp.]|uniref:hypothetical protein n=1 Tax=uncultured Clostridium sp. TaxID=59620 RepID=UPI00263427A7|nr:hypothetical protein [uncultured Clostridium sp.]